VHGLATNAYVWQNLIGQLSDVRRCIAVDLPLHGQSLARPEQQLTIGAFADVLDQVCEGLDLSPVDLVAHDTGGAIAQVLAARHPERLRTLTLTNCETQDNIPPAAMAAIVEAARAGQFAPTVPALLADPVASRAFFAPGYQDPAHLTADLVTSYLAPLISTADAAERFQDLIAGLGPDELAAAGPGLRTLEVPTLIAWGTDDDFFALKWAYWLRDTIPGADEVVEITDGKLFFPHERAADLAPHIRRHWTAPVKLELLQQVTEEFAAYLSEVTDGDLTAPTPCHRWAIQDLYAHMLDVNARLAEALDPRAAPPAPRGGCAPRETIYRDSARYAADALAGAGEAGEEPLESLVANTLIHTWDIAQATQLKFDPPSPHAIDIALRYLHRLPLESRGQDKQFAAILDFPAAAPMDEILFLSGRTPTRRT
jgi:uncharacterized protein (TIGR03086 family)